MEKRYKITPDAAKRLLELKIWGFWREEEFLEFEKDWLTTVDRYSVAWKSFNTLVDVTEFPAQSPAVQTRLTEVMKHLVEKGLHKSARIVAESLTQLQLQRIGKSIDGQRFANFNTREEALKWLNS